MVIDIEQIKDTIRGRHSGDEKQLEVIFSPENRLLVEAPAGYGKTNTMISKIAYMLITNQIPYPKRLLALTFSVNASYKIKRDVNKQIPEILNQADIDVNSKLLVSNYHGFCRIVLRKYGYLFHDNLKKMDTLQSIDDSNIQRSQENISGLSYDDAKKLSDFSDAVKKIDSGYIKDNINEYNEIVIRELLPREIISYNSILTLTIALFRKNNNSLNFYHKYFTSILVDEYQDTNILSYRLLNYLITDASKVIVLGDSLQRIYGFIGAIPKLLDTSEKQLKLKRLQLTKNYRFQNNSQMLLLDNNIRKNAEKPRAPSVIKNAKINFNCFTNQNEEVEFIISKALEIIEDNGHSRIAILVKQRGRNVDRLIQEFNNKGVVFFYGLFTDEDPSYVSFNRKCLFEFIKLLKVNEKVTRTQLKKLVENIKEKSDDNSEPLTKSLLKLLCIFTEKIFTDFAFLSNEGKIDLVKDTFEHNGLRQYLEYVDSNIIISTVHGAKGLEWDYVILPDMEAYSFPNYYGLCGDCQSRNDCNLEVTKSIEHKFLQELSIFYVAVTRAKKQVYFTASRKRIHFNGDEVDTNISCFLKLPGIKIKELNSGDTRLRRPSNT